MPRRNEDGSYAPSHLPSKKYNNTIPEVAHLLHEFLGLGDVLVYENVVEEEQADADHGEDKIDPVAETHGFVIGGLK